MGSNLLSKRTTALLSNLISDPSGLLTPFFVLTITALYTSPFLIFDFGNASRVKKVYAVYVTYKADNALTGYFTLEEDDGTSHALSGTVATNATNYATVKLTPSAPITCNKVSIKLDTSSNSRKVEINDISIEYREIYKRSG